MKGGKRKNVEGEGRHKVKAEQSLGHSPPEKIKRNLLGSLMAYIASLPPGPFIRFGRIFGTLAYLIDRRHRRIVRRNIRFTYPHMSSAEVRHFTRRVFRSVGITLFEILQMACFTREDVLRRVRIRGKENLLKAASAPRGAIMISAHLGNWEMSQICVACLLQKSPVSVARKVNPEFLNHLINRFRTRFGSIILDKGGALPKMVRALRRGSIVGILIDQGTLPSESVDISFFGKRVTATPAAAILARRFDSPVLPAFCVREADGGLTLIVEPPLQLKRTDDRQADIQENTQTMNDAIEKAVRSYPDQWFWFHKRWKRHYPHLYPEDRARRRRQKAKRARSLEL